MMIIITNTNNNSSRIQTTFFKQIRFFSKSIPAKFRFGKPSPNKTGGISLVQLRYSRPNLDLKLHNASTILHSPGGNRLEMEEIHESCFKSFESKMLHWIMLSGRRHELSGGKNPTIFFHERILTPQNGEVLFLKFSSNVDLFNLSDDFMNTNYLWNVYWWIYQHLDFMSNININQRYQKRVFAKH